MNFNVIPDTNIRVSRLAFGTASLHHRIFQKQRQELLGAAADVGITHFDTSPYYGYGLAESDLGQFMAGRRARFTVATKVGLYPWMFASRRSAGVWMRKALGTAAPVISLPVVNWSVDQARISLHQSLSRLKCDYVDFLFVHEPDITLLQIEEFMRWIEDERIRGTVRAFGVAGTAPHVMPFVAKGLSLAGVVQTQDSLDRRQADFLKDFNRVFQFTYGYLSGREFVDQHEKPESILQKALHRNRTGAVIVSTRRAHRLRDILLACP